MSQSAELTGGAGFSFEANVAAYYLVSLITEDSAPGLNNRIVTRVALQQTSFGEPLDDVIIDACSSDGELARLSLQVKSSLTISSTNSNKDFREVVTNSWLTLNKDGFRENVDRYGAATGNVSEAKRRHLNNVCEFAKASLDEQTFFQRFADDGNAGGEHLVVVEVFRNILTEHTGRPITDGEIHRFLKHFVLIKLDFLHEGATSPSLVIPRLRESLAQEENDRAPDLWLSLVNLAREGAGRSEEFSHSSLLVKLLGTFRLAGSRSIKPDLDNLIQISRLSLNDIVSEIDGFHVARHRLVDQVRAQLDSYRFVQIKGLPGTGKSVVLKEFAGDCLQEGPVLLLKSDRLAGSSWAEYSNSIGLRTQNIESLLVEIASSGTAILLIDGIDRIQPAQRKIVLDLLNSVLASPLLSSWRILVTSRDMGIEPLRNWLPPALIGGGIGVVDVGHLTDDEAEELANAKPALKSLLFGKGRVKEIARRPFFAYVLARGFSYTTMDTNFIPQSEADLAEAWWQGGGYNAEANEVFKRQYALEELAKVSARRLGFKIQQSELSIGTTEVIHLLISDGIIQEAPKGIGLKFSHDIFFEWAYFYLLRRKGDQWLEALTEAGEPPVLSRVVELLSQAYFSEDAEWVSHLAKIETSSLRHQWQRAWLLGPLSAPDFDDHSDTYEKAITQDNYSRLFKLYVWYQAEKTTPNTLVLNGQLVVGELNRNEVIRLADLLGWPSDISAWRRLIVWTLNAVHGFPRQVIPDVLTSFQVWQNALGDYPNALSDNIIKQCFDWLIDIENKLYPEELRFDYGEWNKLSSEELKALAESLRILVLRATRTNPAVVQQYLEHILNLKRIRRHVFLELLRFSQVLSQHFPQLLVEISSAELMDDLPEDARKRWIKSRQPHAFIPTDSFIDWEDLSIGRSHEGFYPPSPLREPFNSLLLHSPKSALEFIRKLTNHAITAWLQLHKISHERQGTPIPVMMNFPWGQQKFWGSMNEYGWFRGWRGPQPVQCALMALESWAYSEVKNGRAVDDVLRDVLEGHSCISVLGIAVAVALETQHVSQVTLALLSSQGLWDLDIKRYVNESPSVAVNLMGFGIGGFTSSEKDNMEAVRLGNGRKCRKSSLRDLTPLFVLHHDAGIREASREALGNFPNDLPFSYEEEKSSSALVNNLRSTAEIWAEWGKRENYKISTTPEDKSRIAIQLENPKANSPEVKSEMARLTAKVRGLSLWNWVHQSFESQSLCGDFSIVDAIKIAKEFDHPKLFSDRASSDDNDILLGAIAGVASAILCFSDRTDEESVSWAREVVLRAFETTEKEFDYHSSTSIVPWHPCLFVAGAFASEIRASGDRDSKEKLLALAGHPLESVSIEALKCAFDCWDIDDRFAWTALDLGMRLSIGSRKRGVKSAYGYDPAFDDVSLKQAVREARKTYFKKQCFTDLTLPPPPWEPVPQPAKWNILRRQRIAEQPQWKQPDIIWRWDYAPKVIEIIPVEKIMADSARQKQFLSLCEGLLTWTIEKINPVWEKDLQEKKRKKTDLNVWTRQLSTLLANVSGFLDADTVKDRFLSKIFIQEDELCASFLAPIITLLTRKYIMDADRVSPNVLKIVDICADRILQDGAFKESRNGILYGFDLPCIVRELLFVSVENASGAARYANGRWNDIDIVLPIVNKLVTDAGWVSAVARDYLTLCERCGAFYPAEVFTDQVLAIFGRGKLPGWKGTELPARIAGLIQTYADREHPLEQRLSQKMLRILDLLVDLGDRRSAALQTSEAFKDVRNG
jgi:hypothetical protein